ncbi:MAG: flagellar protein FliS [Pseudomonadota bacterium]
MNARALGTYRRQSVETTDAAGVLLLLLDGLQRFCDEAQQAFAANCVPRALEQTARARAIVDELLVSLDRTQAPELCDNLSGIYSFASRRLVEALTQRSGSAVAEAWRALAPVVEGFRKAVPRARAEGLRAARR